MIKKLNTMVFTLILFLGFVMSTLAAAPQMSRHLNYRIGMAERGMYSARILLRLKDKIGLTEAQVKQIEKYDLAFKQSQVKHQSEIKLLRIKLQAAFKNENIERKQLEGLIRSIAKYRTNLEVDRFHYLLDIKEVLNKAQLQKLEQFKKEMMKRRWHRRPRNSRQFRRFPDRKDKRY